VSELGKSTFYIFQIIQNVDFPEKLKKEKGKSSLFNLALQRLDFGG